MPAIQALPADQEMQPVAFTPPLSLHAELPVCHVHVPLNCCFPMQACPLFGPLMQRALELIKDCKCTSDSGCPACVQHTDCGEYNAVLSKQAGIIVLECVLAAEEEYRGRLSLQVRELYPLNLFPQHKKRPSQVQISTLPASLRQVSQGGMAPSPSDQSLLHEHLEVAAQNVLSPLWTATTITNRD